MDTQNTKCIQLQRVLPRPPQGALSPGLPLGLRPQTPVIGLRSACALAPKLCQGPTLIKALP